MDDPISMRFSTVPLPARDRFDQWLERVCETYVALDVSPGDECGFFAELDATAFGDTVVAELSGSAQTARRTPSLIEQNGRELSIFIQQLSGEASIEQDGRTVMLRSGEGVLVDTTRPYSFHLSGPFRQRVIHCPRRQMRNRLPVSNRLSAVRVDDRTAAGGIFCGHIEAFSRRRHRLNADVGKMVASQALDLLAAALSETPEGGAVGATPAEIARLGRVKAYIRAHLCDPDLSPGSVAAANALSVRQLHRLFQAEGVSVSDWIRSRRLELARGWLRDPALRRFTVTEIAYRCGFNDSSHFSRLYRARYDRAPLETRREALDEKAPALNRS